MSESDADATESEPEPEPAPEPEAEAESSESAGLPDRVAFWVSVVFGLALATGSVWYVGQQGIWFEALQRVRPALAGGGVGADWEYGIEIALLNGLIELIHIADILLGIFILLLVFVHWAAFHRLAAQMQPPEGEQTASEPTIADGGTPSDGGDGE
ncbi:MAG: hypothetical protein ACI8UR_000475 [Natronomonas sp.]|jgi:hypothetical protein|uniref:hypothetical protein n=1 Tax=Natronomonas sp. TaxID=2184060 RepID=UPI003989552A